jgi:hypothetical protein
MAKKRAHKKFKKLKFGADSPLPPELRNRLEQIDMNHLREVLENAPSRGMTDEERAMVVATTMSLAEARVLLTGSDEFQVTLPEGVPPLDYRKGPSA